MISFTGRDADSFQLVDQDMSDSEESDESQVQGWDQDQPEVKRVHVTAYPRTLQDGRVVNARSHTREKEKAETFQVPQSELVEDKERQGNGKQSSDDHSGAVRNGSVNVVSATLNRMMDVSTVIVTQLVACCTGYPAVRIRMVNAVNVMKFILVQLLVRTMEVSAVNVNSTKTSGVRTLVKRIIGSVSVVSMAHMTPGGGELAGRAAHSALECPLESEPSGGSMDHSVQSII
eukprot:1273003-Amphidinium_carterae.4